MLERQHPFFSLASGAFPSDVHEVLRLIAWQQVAGKRKACHCRRETSRQVTYFNDKCVLISGAASGIGFATADLFLDHGATVVGCDIQEMDPDKLGSTDLSRLHGEKVDITDEGQVNRLVEKVLFQQKAIDVLVNCAGIGLFKPMLETSLQEFERVLAVNVRGTFLLGRAVIRQMVGRKSGRVINIASELGSLGRENCSIYCASKGAVISMTRSWAREYAPDIQVNAVAPGPVDTPLLDIESMEPERVERELDIPMRRIGRPSEIASAIKFLAGPESTFMTGQTVGVNGGAAMY